jgi:hypothetical protein
VPYSQFEETSSVAKPAFYKVETSYNFRNNGNVMKTETVYEPISILKTLFLSTEPKAELVRQDGKSYLAWSLQLRPNETQVVKVTENYLPLLIFVLVVLAVILVIALMRGPITVNKTATLIAKQEGGIGGLKVVIRIKNHTKVMMRELEVVDSVPNIVAVDRNIEAGHLAPTNVVDRGSRGILVKWKLGDLEPNEEKIVSYKAVSRLTILGSFTLPATVVRCIQNYKEKMAYSNRLRIKI